MPKLISLCFLVLSSAVLLLSSCATEKNDSGFSKNPGPISANLIGALQDGEDPNTVPEVKRNFLKACVTGATGSIPDLVAIQETGLLRVCGCSYDRMVQYFIDQATSFADSSTSLSDIENSAFASFKDLDDDFRKGSGEFTDKLHEVFEQCIRDSAPTISS